MASRFSRLIGKKSQPHFVLDSTASPLTPPSLLPSSGGLDSDEEDILEFYAMDGVESDDHFHSPAWSGKFEPAHNLESPFVRQTSPLIRASPRTPTTALHSPQYPSMASSSTPQSHAISFSGPLPPATIPISNMSTAHPPIPNPPHPNRTIRKSSSGKKLFTGIPSPVPLPDPSAFPDPYPSSGFNTTTTTPPVSLFSAGSSSARSSAYTSASPASAIRSSLASSDSAQHTNNNRLPASSVHTISPSSKGNSVDLFASNHINHAITHAPTQSFLDPPQPTLSSTLATEAHVVGLATTADKMVQLADASSPGPSIRHGRAPSQPQALKSPSRPGTLAEYPNPTPEQTRWSSSEEASNASKTSSWGNFNSGEPVSHHPLGPPLGQTTQYEWSNHVVDEKDEFVTDEDDDHDESGVPEEEDRTAAIVLAEQGHGEIVHGEGRNVADLIVPPNTTHLLLGQTSSPNHLPSFLATVLPGISHSLLALDISASFLVSLPPALSACSRLEELNIASNPLRALPPWLAVLTSLRVLILDFTGIGTIPPSLSGATQLHTISIRHNRLHYLPSWLCLLPSLQTLYLEGNPFQGPWKALVEPLMPRPVLAPPQPPSKTQSPLYPPNTPHTATSLDSVATDYSSGNSDHGVDPGFLPKRTEEHTKPVPIPSSARGHRTTSSRDFNVGSLHVPGQATTLQRARSATLEKNFHLPTHSVHTASPSALSPSPSSSFTRPKQVTRPFTAGGAADASSRPLSRMKTAPTRRSPSAATAANHFLNSLEPRNAPQPLTSSISVADMMMMSGVGTGGVGTINGGIRMAGTPRHMRPDSAGGHSLRRMKSAGDVNNSSASEFSDSQAQLQQQPGRGDPEDNGVMSANPGLGRFMSVGTRGPMKPEYRALTATMFENPPAQSTIRFKETKEREKDKDKEKDKHKWGFFKKMSTKSRSRASSSAGHDAEAAEEHAILGPPRPMGGMGGPSNSLPIVPRSVAPPGSPGVAAAVPAPAMTASQVAFRSSTNLTQSSISANSRRLLTKKYEPVPVHAVPSPNSIPPPPSAAMMAQLPLTPSFLALPIGAVPGGLTPRKSKRRSFLPVGPAPINIPAPPSPHVLLIDGGQEHGDELTASPIVDDVSGYPVTPITSASGSEYSEERERERHQRALRSVMAYLRDMCDLSAGTTNGALAVAAAAAQAQAQGVSQETSPQRNNSNPPSRRPTLASADGSRIMSEFSSSTMSTFMSGTGMSFSQANNSVFSGGGPSTITKSPSSSSIRDSEIIASPESETQMPPMLEEKKPKDEKGKRAMIIKEIVTTERTYVKGLQELVDIYVTPASLPVTGISSNKETVVPANERKIVFNGLESLFSFHKESFLPSLEKAYEILAITEDEDGEASFQAAIKVAQVFVSHAAFMRMYSTYINNFDNAVRRTKQWTEKNISNAVVATTVVSPNASTSHLASSSTSDNALPSTLTTSQKKRIKQYLKRCRTHPRHSQLNMEGYLLLPVQRIPRYRLLLEELVRSTPPKPDSSDYPLDRALSEITALASNMNEGKRESESRRKLVQWQSRIRGKFPSPLVQPHRRLIMDGRLQLTRVVRKTANYFEVVNIDGEKSLVSIECLSPEVTPRSLTAILCNDLLVLCKDPSGGADAGGFVDLWAVLRMQTVPQPASIVHGSALRLVDNKAILYFDLPSTTEALTWSRAINMHIPATTK